MGAYPIVVVAVGRHHDSARFPYGKAENSRAPALIEGFREKGAQWCSWTM